MKFAAYALVALFAPGVSLSLHATAPASVWPRPFFTGQGGLIESSPALGPDGTIYIGNENAYLFAINRDGSLKWPFHAAGGAIESTPAIGPDGTIYFGCDDGNLYAVAAANGQLKWPFQTGGYIYSSPAIGADGTIYVGSGDGSLYAVSPAGDKIWSFATGGKIDSSPAIGSDGTIYIGSYDKSLYAINPDGSLKWTFPTGDRIVAPPAIGADGTIYVGSKDGHLYALTPGGNSKWTTTTGGPVETSPAIGPNGAIYFGSNDGYLYATASDGTPLWRDQLGSVSDPLVSSPAVRSDGTIVVGAGNNSIVAINPDGTSKWQYSTGDFVDSSPVVAPDGTIYVGSWDANLYALTDGGPGPANSAWPLFHHDLARAGRSATSTGSAANPGRLVNLSVLDPLSPSNPMLTVGFVSGGTGVSGTQNVLVRGIGPSLATFLPDPVVADPALTVYLNTTLVDSNDNWADTPINQSQVAIADTLVYAFPLTDPSSLDSALVMSVVPNPGYSVQVTGGNPGYALAEVYDATRPEAYTPTTPRLINLSCLANLPGDGTLTAGFIIGGSTPETVMIRATGPGLANFHLGSGNLMPDPALSLHTNLNGEDRVLGVDQGWNATPQVVSSIVFDSKSVGAFALPASSQDSVLLVTLAPGAYTAQVQSYHGVGGTTLIEVYEIP